MVAASSRAMMPAAVRRETPFWPPVARGRRARRGGPGWRKTKKRRSRSGSTLGKGARRCLGQWRRQTPSRCGPGPSTSPTATLTATPSPAPPPRRPQKNPTRRGYTMRARLSSQLPALPCKACSLRSRSCSWRVDSRTCWPPARPRWPRRPPPRQCSPSQQTASSWTTAGPRRPQGAPRWRIDCDPYSRRLPLLLLSRRRRKPKESRRGP
mmetsp:Transcript_2802/g.3899  ORF Transcript_2802/g.3899 Transcript_2802/m.3899 type:complete len:210 (+) Transcript_2802:1183-1812(+)